MATEILLLHVDELHFDPRNPRLPLRVAGEHDEQVLDWMLLDAGLLELMGSIAENGFFPAEPLLVVQNDSGPGYIVLEGNRRLAAVKLLLRPEEAPRRKNAVATVASRAQDTGDLVNLPAVVFTDAKRVMDYLGFRHVTGIKQWEPAAKARYLRSLYDGHIEEQGQDVYRAIARIIGSRADYVRRLLAALYVYERMTGDKELAARGVEEETISFSLITLALNYTEIRIYLKLTDLDQESLTNVDPSRIRRLGEYLFVRDPVLGRTQLGESRNMRLLANTLKHPEGRRRLKSGLPVEEATEFTLDLDHVLALSLQQAKDRLSRSRDLIPRAQVTDAVLSLLEEIDELLAKTYRTARRRRHESVEDV